MTAQLAPTPVFRGTDAFGFPLYLGQLGTFIAGTNTPQVTYKDSTQVAQNTNPIILNPRGECNLWLDPTKAYKLVLSDALGNQIWTVDNITIGNANPSFSIIPTVDNLFTLGSPTFSFANLYLGPNHAPVLDTVSGNIGYYARTAAEIAASVTPTNFSYPPGNVLRYGADFTGVVDSAAAFLQARQVATQGSIELLIPGGTYKSTATLVWGFANLQVTATGKVVINFTNAGQCITIDGGAGGGGIYGVTVRGYIKVVGNASTTDAWFVRACHHSKLQMRAGDCTTGLRTNWCVLNTFEFVCSSNEGTFSTLVPSTGMFLDQRAVGETTAGCTFTDCILEGILGGSGIGIDLQGTFCNTFLGGSSESNKIGGRQANSNNIINTFYGMDFESNGAPSGIQDFLVLAGSNLTFMNCRSFSLATPQPNIDLQGGDNTAFFGGNLRWVHVVTSPTVTGTTFVGCQVSNGVSVGIKLDAGASIKALGVQLISGLGVVTGAYNDDLGNSGTFIPTISGGTTPGTQTYAANGQKGFYTLNGHVCSFTIFINLTANGGGAAGTAILGGLPFSGRNQTNCFQSFNINDYSGITLGAAGRTLSATMNPGSATAAFIETDTGSVHNPIAITAIAATANFVITGTYLID